MPVLKSKSETSGHREASIQTSSVSAKRSVKAMGLAFANPLGLAAGFDRTGALLPALRTVGFGHVEIGTVTPESGLAGGLGGPGTRLPIGVNIGSARSGIDQDVIDDYTAMLKQVFGLCDYIAVNLSAPASGRNGNTPGVETLVKRLSVTRDVLAALKGHRTPLLLKIEAGPDGRTFPTAIMMTCVYGLDGVILVSDDLERVHAISAYLDTIPLISVGGVRSADDVRARLAAGATLVQVHRAYSHGGPKKIGRILKELASPAKASSPPAAHSTAMRGLVTPPAR